MILRNQEKLGKTKNELNNEPSTWSLPRNKASVIAVRN